MFEFTGCVSIEARPEDVWEHVAVVERRWLASNPDT
jgi:hypothetical protein